MVTKKNSKQETKYNFNDVLKIINYFIEIEAKGDKGTNLRKLKKIQKKIRSLSLDLANLALGNNWYDREVIDVDKLEDLVEYDKKTETFRLKK